MGNCPQSLYYAWESIVRHGNGGTEVNLLLNRASPWLNVDSYLPYEGKVVLKNKRARRVHVRIPVSVDKRAVRLWVQGREVPLVWLNNYLLVDGIGSEDVITVEFPMVETSERYTEPTFGVEYTFKFRGNTVVDASPRPEKPAWEILGQDDGTRNPITKSYPLFDRERYKGDRAPMIEKERYVAPKLI